ncbi:MAG: GGDEF domain-containing protein [Massilia sp.]|nr:GGDEF domain-containing protein [Massilia sp.]
MLQLTETSITRGGEFRDPVLEAQFRQRRLPDAHTQMRGTLLLLGLAMSGFFVTDFAAMGVSPTAFLLLGIRLTVTALALGCWVLLRRRPDSVIAMQGAACAISVAALAGLLTITWLRSAELPSLAMTLALMLMTLYLNVPNRLRYAVAIGVPASAAFGVLVTLKGSMAGPEIITLCLLLATINVIGYLAARRHHRLWRNELLVQLKLEQLALLDQLTGCYNRRFLHKEQLDGQLGLARRSTDGMTVILCDIDHFKNINDTYGHQAGDEVLVAFAALLRAETRQQIDSVVRYGGEEFLLLLPGTELGGGEQLAERLRAMLAHAPLPIQDARAVAVTASFGVAAIGLAQAPDSATLFELIGLADTLLYQSKQAGRNQVHARQLG